MSARRPAGWSLEAAAIALRTTDSRTKLAGAVVELPDADGRPVTVRVSGIAKGVGMIYPDMATLLSYIATDARLTPEAVQECLRRNEARLRRRRARRICANTFIVRSITAAL